MAMAIRDSVTVSMAEETSGMRSEMRRLSRAVVSASVGTKVECAGSSSTSSNVRAGGLNFTSSLMSHPYAEIRIAFILVSGGG
jgi:hypothetical protein